VHVAGFIIETIIYYSLGSFWIIYSEMYLAFICHMKIYYRIRGSYSDCEVEIGVVI
jgi:hypothetical protein